MKLIAVCLIAVIAIGFGRQTKSSQDKQVDLRPAQHSFQTDGVVQNAGRQEAKQANRDRRYSDPAYLAHGFTGYSKMPAGTRRVSEEGGGVAVETEGYIDQATFNRKLSERDLSLRRENTCSADAVVVGYIKDYRGVITSDDSSIYTVYTLAVGEVLKSRFPIKSGSDLEATKAGGTAQINGGSVSKLDVPVKSLSARSQYILFLKYDQQADDYYLIDRTTAVYTVGPAGGLARLDLKTKDDLNTYRLKGAPTTKDALLTEIQTTLCNR